MGSTKRTRQFEVKDVVKRPDGDLGIKGTNSWMPGNLFQVQREIEWTRNRLSELDAAETFLIAQDSPVLTALLAMP